MLRCCLNHLCLKQLVVDCSVLPEKRSAVSRELLEPVHRFGHPKNEPRKSSSTLPKSSLFIKQLIISFLLFEIYQKQLVILNTFPWVKYSRTEEKYEKFMRNMQQLPKPWCTTVISFWTCDGWQIQFIRGLKLHINFYCFS